MSSDRQENERERNERKQSDELFCVAASPCLSYPCLNGGACTAGSNSTYSCECADGFQGPNCETEKTQGEGLGTAGHTCSHTCSHCMNNVDLFNKSLVVLKCRSLADRKGQSLFRNRNLVVTETGWIVLIVVLVTITIITVIIVVCVCMRQARWVSTANVTVMVTVTTHSQLCPLLQDIFVSSSWKTCLGLSFVWTHNLFVLLKTTKCIS